MPAEEKLIFNRYTREECGLPPLRTRADRLTRLATRVLLVAVFLVGAGWLAGGVMARWREYWLGSLPALVRTAGPGEVPELLHRGRLYAAALDVSPTAAYSVAAAATIAAERSPRRMGYYGNAAIIFDEMRSGPEDAPWVVFHANMLAGAIYSELGDFDKAFASLEKADRALAATPDGAARRGLRLQLVNMHAYLLATAPEREGRNPEKALHLAQLMISSRDELSAGFYASGSAAFLDTLAMAWYAAGDPAKAVRTQSFALGLAETGELDVYLKHYDLFLRTKPAGPANLLVGRVFGRNDGKASRSGF